MIFLGVRSRTFCVSGPVKVTSSALIDRFQKGSAPSARYTDAAGGDSGAQSASKAARTKISLFTAMQPRFEAASSASAPTRADSEGHNGARHRGIEAIRASGHWNFDQKVALGLIVGGKSLLLVADQKEAGPLIFGVEIISSRLEAGSHKLAFTAAQPRDELAPSGGGDRLSKNRAHRGAHRFDREGIDAVIDQDQAARADGIAGPQDRPDIARVAQRLRDDPQRRSGPVDRV